jgi:tyrosine-protein phosphatase YwqE
MNIEMEEKNNENNENNENMKLWNKVCETNPNNTKQAKIKHEFTSICAQSQIKKATQIWGSFGKKWGVKDEKFNIILEKNICFYTALFYYPEGSILIHSDIQIFYTKGSYNEDWTKKLATDALTKGLSKIGFNSDIFEGKFEDNKYIQQMNNNYQNNNSNNQNKNLQINENSINEQLLSIYTNATNDDKEKIDSVIKHNGSANAKNALLNYLNKKYDNHSS